ncbi:PTS fructose transporter subunit IIB [Dongshaea marina]|uniref:PTS fructose transporter subunit IIB n=1 Tax=Dongshaea marina TaxID=2047966 RepID=UPI000D3EC9A0|nr:PTS fructose transporter subunit IIB [Dongshaea marina]
MRIIAVTACPTGIAHTYMAADALNKAAHKKGIPIQVETQGAMGIENQLSPREIARADLVLIASNIPIELMDRFSKCPQLQVSIEAVLTNPEKIIGQCQEQFAR